ncbi:uncharacterized protein PG998_007151 [Apiospora kogelbergensis]|uniref:uncharacterized protein n=1 Tax=Apiospora kogelbergensis TaxID=1337665 RepID=UPI00312D405A
MAAPEYGIIDDVSSYVGVRVDGFKEDPDQLEVHTNSVHFTIYKNRGYRIYDTNDVEHGFCQHVNTVSFICGGDGRSGYGEVLVLHCNSDDYTAQVLNG